MSQRRSEGGTYQRPHVGLAVEHKFTHIRGDLISLLHAEPTQMVEWSSGSGRQRDTAVKKWLGTLHCYLKKSLWRMLLVASPTSLSCFFLLVKAYLSEETQD